jgi:hypothetical protein
MSAPLLAIAGLEAGYGEQQVLYGVDLTVGTGWCPRAGRSSQPSLSKRT